MRLLLPPGVFRPRSDTWLLAGAIREEPSVPRGSVLDVCTGSGALAIAAAQAGAREVTAIDVSRRAVAAAWLNARLNGVSIAARRGDVFEPVRNRAFDLIVSNPPYVPATGDALPRRGRRRAWDAGLDGRALLDRIIASAPGHLRPGGALLLVHSSVTGVDATLERLEEHGLDPEVVTRRRGPLGPILAARAEELEALGLLRPGEREEELVVVRASRSG